MSVVVSVRVLRTRMRRRKRSAWFSRRDTEINTHSVMMMSSSREESEEVDSETDGGDEEELIRVHIGRIDAEPR